MTDGRDTNTAFLGVDVQNDFCPGGALAVEEGDAVVPVVNALMNRFHIRVLTQDWHPKNHQSFAVNHPDRPDPFTMTEMPYGPQVLWPEHCVQGSHGAEFHADLETDGAHLVIRKGFRPEIDSYSAFFENDHETPTGLTGYLKDLNVTSVVMAGLATDFCVYFSAVDAAKLGFNVTLIEDGCRAIDLDGSLTAALKDMREHGVRFAVSSEVI